MATDPSKFLLIEKSFVDKITPILQKSLSEVYAGIDDAINAGDYTKASELVDAVDLRYELENNRKVLEYLTNVAMLFGASMVTSTPGTTVVGLGYEKTISYQATQALVNMLANRLKLFLKNTLVQLIAIDKSRQVEKAERILKPFSSSLNDAGVSFINVAASLHASRVSSYGFMAEADAIGLQTYQINEQLDVRICKVCKVMHGKVFKVTDARRLLETALRVDDPADLKALHPWPKQDKASVAALEAMSTDELVKAGYFLPPFHPLCRGLSSRKGKVPKLPDQQLEVYTATQEDFSAVGINATKDEVAFWNDNSPISPAEYLARLQGKTSDQLFSDVLQGVGTGVVARFKNGFTATTTSTIGNVGVTQSVQLIANKEMYLKSVALTSDTIEDAIKAVDTYLSDTVQLARDMELSKVTVDVAKDTGLSYIKYGFVPDKLSWTRMKSAMTKAINSGAIDGYSPLVRDVVGKVLSVDDPSYLAALSDIREKIDGKTIGETLLSIVKWRGELNLSDRVSMERFLESVGKI